MFNPEVNDRLEKIKASVKISDICEITNSNGANNCPHCGKNSCFSVWDDSFYKCWKASCRLNKGGNVVQLYRALNDLDSGKGFYQALDALENLGKISTSKVDFNERHVILSSCLDIYSWYLWAEEGREALAYLRSRGFSDEFIKLIRVGYAPSASCLRHWDVAPSDLRQEGLLDRDREYFSNRIIFPIKDITGRLVHFVGRYLGDVPKDENGDDRFPRYKDSRCRGIPGTKSYLAFEERIENYASREDPYLVLTEGFPDSFVLSQYAIPAAGLLGLEKINSHIHKFSKFKRIICIFDNDVHGPNHPTHAFQYKSWTRIIPQLVELQILLPHTEVFVWMVPEVGKSSSGKLIKSKDINDWFCRSDENSFELWKVVESEKKSLVDALIDRWGSDLSKHSVLIKLISATGRGEAKLAKYIPPELTSPLKYALQVIEA